METNLGYKVKRKKLSLDELLENWLCCSCNIECTGVIGTKNGKRYYECFSGCEGSLKSTFDEIYVVKCSGYKEQRFTVTVEVKKILEGLVCEFSQGTLSGKHNISQGSDSFDGMMEDIYRGFIELLSHRQELNHLMALGRKSR